METEGDDWVLVAVGVATLLWVAVRTVVAVVSAVWVLRLMGVMA
mgnify:FL=1